MEKDKKGVLTGESITSSTMYEGRTAVSVTVEIGYDLPFDEVDVFAVCDSFIKAMVGLGFHKSSIEKGFSESVFLEVCNDD